MPLKYCRSQCYDNVAVMGGHKSGVQERIIEKNTKAVFVSCENHSLNLAGIHAASEESITVTFFGTLDALYNFFSRSTMRWDKLRKAMPITLKSESETRWIAREEAVKPVCHHFDDLVILLEEMSTDLKGNNYDVMGELRTRVKKRMPGGTNVDVGLSAKQEIMRLMKGKSSGLLDDERMKENCLHVGEFYSDLDGNELYEEILDCRMLLASRTDVQIFTPEKLIQFIIQYGDENVFPNLTVAIQLMLTVGISIASCERSFSKLILIMAYLRASMGQDRLNALAFLSSDREEAELINFDDVIDNFASAESRRVQN
ncbi:uncharacterized protein [Macrobrachium rosenbergii]|uniref:uncharacterized protein n=1 Tax=Macrobrachium rosenbergii TaxID=79674 RepID=UPI0034D71ACB